MLAAGGRRCLALRVGLILNAASSTAGSAALRGRSDVEPEVHHIAVVDDVIPSFQPHPSGLLRAGFALEADVVVERDRFGADEALLKIRVNDAGGLGSRRA